MKRILSVVLLLLAVVGGLLLCVFFGLSLFGF